MARPIIYDDDGMSGRRTTRSDTSNNPASTPGTYAWWENQQGTPYTPPGTPIGDITFPWEDTPTGGNTDTPNVYNQNPNTPIYENNPMDTGVVAPPPTQTGYTKPSGGGTGSTTTPPEVTTPTEPTDPNGTGFDFGDSMFGDWQNNASNSFDPQSILDFIANLPGAERNAELYAPLIAELQGLIQSKGQSGLVPVEQQFANVQKDITEASDNQFQRTMGDLARSGTLESGGLREARIRENIALNRGLATERVAIETANSQQAASKYSQALTQMQQLQQQAAQGEIDWFQAALQMNALGAENERAWAQMGLSERLTMTGYDVEKYKADQGAQLQRERNALDEMLGLKDINMRELIEANNFSIEQTKISLQKWMVEGGWQQDEANRALERWGQLLQAEVQNKRTDVDMINAMGKLTRDQWEKEISQADLELKRYLGQQEYDLRKQELGQDWNKFLQQQATTRWMASNQWQVDKWIAQTQANAQGGGWGGLLGDLISAGGTIGAAAIMASSIDFKKDVSELTGSEQAAIRKQLINMKVYDYRYKGESDDRKKHIGILVEESPDAIVTDDGKHISLQDAFGMMLVTIKALEREVQELKNAS